MFDIVSIFIYTRFLLFSYIGLGVLWKEIFTELVPCKNGKNHKY